MTISIVDFSALFHRIWHANHEEAVHRVAGIIRNLPEERVIIAVDSPPYDRKKIDPEYKANRDVPDPELVGQLRECIEQLANDGYEIARCQGWEADDVIGTLVQTTDATVYGADKDLLQITDIVDPLSGEIKTPTCLGVKRDQVVDYLCLVGDTSDNVKGVNGIGPKTAVKMLKKYGYYFEIMDAVRTEPNSFRPSTREALLESLDWMDTTRELVTIRTDLDIEFEQRERKPVEFESEPVQDTAIEIIKEQPTHIATVKDVEFRHTLEPIGIEQAYRFAKMADASALYQKFRGPEQIMMTIMRGRAFGMDATTALDSIDMIQGKPTMKASMIAGLIMSNPKCEFLECVHFGDDKCTWETKRVGGRNTISRTFTIQEADRLGLSSKDNWKKQPGVMLQWRCVTALARQVYPDIMLGIYGREEFE
jgi:5'-3' exonuclease